MTDVSLEDKVTVRLNTRKVNVLQDLLKELCVRKGTDDAHDLGDKDLGHGRIGGFHLSFKKGLAKLSALFDRSNAGLSIKRFQIQSCWSSLSGCCETSSKRLIHRH